MPWLLCWWPSWLSSRHSCLVIDSRTAVDHPAVLPQPHLPRARISARRLSAANVENLERDPQGGPPALSIGTRIRPPSPVPRGSHKGCSKAIPRPVEASGLPYGSVADGPLPHAHHTGGVRRDRVRPCGRARSQVKINDLVICPGVRRRRLAPRRHLRRLRHPDWHPTGSTIFAGCPMWTDCLLPDLQ